MSHDSRRLLNIVVLVLLIILIAAGGLALLIRQPFPQTSGEIRLPGLQGPVVVLRDGWGVPHIYAESDHDLFLAQGFVHAQDRFWQMDFWRHIGAGRLAEIFGESQVETDAFIRTLGWPVLAEREWELADAATRASLEAYAAGVNAYLEGRRGIEISFEYAVIALLNPDYAPEHWLPVHSLTWAKAMAWDLGGNMESELRRSILLPQLGPDRLADLYPEYPAASPDILPGFRLAAGPSVASGSVSSLPEADYQAVLRRVQSLQRVAGGGFAGLGSNNWVVSGSRTSTGKPILANDPHLGIRMPSIWYQNALHCETVSDACTLNVTGFSFAGLPGVVIGHNQRIAWGVTNTGPDVQDLFLERVNPNNPDQVQLDGQWVDMQIRDEVILVAGGDPVVLRVRQTGHGPVLSDVDDELEALADGAAVEDGAPIVISLRWTALEPSTILQAALALNRAGTFEEFRDALRAWDVPSQNFVYADIDGNIGYQMPGEIPIRGRGDGSLPQPGWDSSTDWRGEIPFEDLPWAYNPPAGFIATANNRVVGPAYPYLLSTQFDLGYRAGRIVELLEASAALTPEDMRTIQGDSYNPAGPRLTPYLIDLDFHKPGEDDPARKKADKLMSAVSLLRDWDYQDKSDSPAAALFNATWRHLVLRTFGDDLPEGWLPGDDSAIAVLTALLARPADPWWDDLRTRPLETRDEILRLAVGDAVAELEDRLGPDSARWSWGALHGATFRNESLGESGIAPIEALFNRGPFPTSGGASIVNATGWDLEVGYQVAWVPSMRAIYDLGDWERSLAIHTTGQSGHAFHPHYVDMAPLWARVEYAPLPFGRAQVELLASDRLLLTP